MGTTAAGADALAALTRSSRVLVAVVVRSLTGVAPRLTVVQLRVLVMVWGAGTMTVSQIAAGLGVNASSASRSVERLVRSGMLQRRQQSQDRRYAETSLTPQGQHVVDTVMERRRVELAALLSSLTSTELNHLRHGLEALNRAADRLDAGPDEGRHGVGVDHHLLGWMA